MKEFKGLTIYDNHELRRLDVRALTKTAIRIDESVLDGLKWEAIYAECSVNELIRAILEDWLKRNANGDNPAIAKQGDKT